MNRHQRREIEKLILINDEQEEFAKTYHCNWRGKCKRKPYIEAFPLKDKPKERRQFPCDVWEFDGWSYLCFWHFQYERLRYFVKRRILRKKVALGYGYAETLNEGLERIREDME